MNTEIKHYIYEGPVVDPLTNKCISSKWKSGTHANNERKALSNLMSQFRKRYGFIQTKKLKFTGVVIEQPREKNM